MERIERTGPVWRETEVVSQKRLAGDIYSMWIQADDVAAAAHAGQFLSLNTRDKSRLLPRPISICEINREQGRVRIVYRVAGAGTAEFSQYRPKDPVSLAGPFGNGFPTKHKKPGQRAFLIGGGIGIPPMLELAKAITDAASKDIILGYRNNELVLAEDLKKYGNMHVATEDGSAGIKGHALNIIETEGLSADVIFACGPMPMLRAVKHYADMKSIPAYISLEERMACGVGACLGCVVKTKEIDHHSHVNNARICTDGPVYLAERVEI